MANYTVVNATEDFFNYLGINREDVKSVPNTNNRGYIICDKNGSECVVFLYPVSCKNDDSKRFFDTRDSGPVFRALAWKYAVDNNLKYFCIAVHSQNYKDYLLSLESPEERISQVSGLENGQRRGKSGTQVVIPNSFRPQKPFERIKTQYGFFISFIKKELFFDYITVFDNRPYNSDTDDVEEEAPNGGYEKFGFNKLFYGVPGCGKSYSVDKFIENEGISKSFVRRVVFHPDYTYSDFVGQIMPKTNDTEEGKKIEYTFVPGPFTDILKVAYENPDQKCVLVIEELNRGNAPAIFGDLFQLLDREEDHSKKDYKWSKYHVTNKDIAENAIFERDERDFFVRIPPNLAIIATMNTSDQNVFSMDTAFQRRWQMQHIRNVFTGEHADKLIEGTLITWKAFATTVNELLTEKSTMFGNSEDKCLGAYFAIDAELEDRQRFAEKVLKYLWDDAFKMEPDIVFGKAFKSLSKVIESFEDATGDALKIVLKDEVYKAMLDKSTPAQVQAEEEADEEIIEQE